MSALPKPVVALLYSRVSTARQAEDGFGLDAQDSKTRLHAQLRGWPVVGSFREEGISGKADEHKRPALLALLQRVRELRAEGNEVVVVVYAVSRLARRQRLLWNLLEENGLLISSATESFDTTTPTGKAMLGMLAVFAQLEADMCAERTKDGLAEAKAQGKRLGAPNSMQLASEAVQLVKKLSDSGASLQAIADQMNINGVRTPLGSTNWVKSTVVRALKAAKEAEKNASAEGTSRIHG